MSEMNQTSFKRVVKLVMCTEQNNNKFYNMFDSGTGSFFVNYGRVGGRETREDYPISKWESLYKSKVKKGYKDVTSIFATTVVNKSGFIDITNPSIKRFFDMLQTFARKSVTDNYTVAVANVTIQQVDEAQKIIDEIANLINIGIDTSDVNRRLLNLYTVIPRKMNNVKNYIFDFPSIKQDNIEKVRRLVSSEQDTLDVMKGQVTINKDEISEENKGITILDSMGVKMEEVSSVDVSTIKNMMQQEITMFKRAFKIENTKTRNRFNNFIEKSQNKKIEQYWHGSRNENWLNIINTGLLIRPSNAIITGAMFGNGCYFANKFRKSLGYTSKSGSYWTNGNSNTGILSIYDVHVGNQYHINNHNSECYNINERYLKNKGNYDSVYAHRGADLRNDEFIVYNVAQTTIKYIVEV